jgi:hypothetical protein
MNSPCLYLSERGQALLYVGEPCSIPVLTLENCAKWYEGLYMVMPDGRVQKVDIEVTSMVMDTHRDALWVDHLYHPRLLWRLAKHLGATLDERAHEVAIGRWMLESGNCDAQVSALNFDDPS